MRPGLSDWKKEKAEVLELLAFCKPEQQSAHRFRIWRPLAVPLQPNQKNSTSNNSLEALFSLTLNLHLEYLIPNQPE